MARIVDLTAHPAVYATRLLAEVGHEVIRVESPTGDDVRRLGPYLGDLEDLEHGVYHQFLNAGKKSLGLDVTSSAGRQILLDLCRTADCVVGIAPLPIAESELAAANPGLVVSIVEDGEPEICAYARSGLLSITGHPGQRPVLMGGHVVYAATGAFVGVATAAALLAADLTGQGEVVRVSLAECMQGLFEQAMVTYATTGRGTERRGYRGAVTAVSGAFPCADGYAMFSIPSNPEGWRGFMKWVQDPVLLEDDSLVDEAERQAKRDFILDRLEQWSRGFQKEDVVTQAQDRHIPASPVATPLDLAHDPQLIHRGFLREVDHPDLGKMLFPMGALATVRGTTTDFAPRLGQHTTEILAELGYSAVERQALRESGVL
jgi:crotonobetainyl-CoA:carnitine CoA-transferase CaiB-like acyl-CoA transferase